MESEKILMVLESFYTSQKHDHLGNGYVVLNCLNVFLVCGNTAQQRFDEDASTWGSIATGYIMQNRNK